MFQYSFYFSLYSSIYSNAHSITFSIFRLLFFHFELPIFPLSFKFIPVDFWRLPSSGNYASSPFLRSSFTTAMFLLSSGYSLFCSAIPHDFGKLTVSNLDLDPSEYITLLCHVACKSSKTFRYHNPLITLPEFPFLFPGTFSTLSF